MVDTQVLLGSLDGSTFRFRVQRFAVLVGVCAVDALGSRVWYRVHPWRSVCMAYLSVP